MNDTIFFTTPCFVHETYTFFSGTCLCHCKIFIPGVYKDLHCGHKHPVVVVTRYLLRTTMPPALLLFADDVSDMDMELETDPRRDSEPLFAAPLLWLFCW